MITGQGLIGSLALFIAEKLLSHKLAISLDIRKRACRAFVELYFSMDRLEELNSEVLELLSSGIKSDGILIGDIELLIPKLNTVSQRFLECRGELATVIELIDPKLARAVTQIYSAKGSFLSLLSNSIEIKNSVELEYYAPDSRILEIDMSLYDEWLDKYSEFSRESMENLEWPQSLLCFGDFEEGFHPARLKLNDTVSLEKLQGILVEHGALLSAAHEKMRVFIGAKFPVEDILYVSKGMQRNEF